MSENKMVPVTYSVGSGDMLLLSHIEALGSCEMDRGTARYLNAICPTVWPSIRLKVEDIPEQPDGQYDIRVKVTVERRFTVRWAVRQPGRYLRWTVEGGEMWGESEDAIKADVVRKAKDAGLAIRFLAPGETVPADWL